MFRIILKILLTLQLVVWQSTQIQFTSNSFGSCLRQENLSMKTLRTCAGKQAIETLQQLSDNDNFTLTDGVVFAKDESVMGRNAPINFLDNDPNDFRALLENAGAIMGERSMSWDMSRIIQGLQLRVGPSVQGGLLEFVMDPNSQYDERSHAFQEESTARIMTKKFVLPFLLGLKFNLATLLPIILGAIILISKKAAFLSKIALFLTSSGLLGLGGLSSLGGYGGYGQGYAPSVIGYQGYHQGGYGYQDPLHHHQQSGVYKVLENNTPRTQEEVLDHFYDYDKKHLLKDRSSRLYEREVDQEKLSKFKPTNQRTFVWAPSNP